MSNKKILCAFAIVAILAAASITGVIINSQNNSSTDVTSDITTTNNNSINAADKSLDDTIIVNDSATCETIDNGEYHLVATMELKCLIDREITDPTTGEKCVIVAFVSYVNDGYTTLDKEGKPCDKTVTFTVENGEGQQHDVSVKIPCGLAKPSGVFNYVVDALDIYLLEGEGFKPIY